MGVTLLVLVRSIEKMELHVYYYPFLILFLANFTSAILHRQNELQNAFGDLFGNDFGGTSDLDDEIDNIFQEEPQQSQQQKFGLNLGNLDGNSFSYIPHPHKSYAPKCEKKVVPFDDVVKIVKIIFQKFPSICISRMKVCGAHPNPNINPLQNPLFVRSMDSVNSNSTSDGESTDFEEGNGEDGKERSKRSTGEDDLNFIPENGDDNQ